MMTHRSQFLLVTWAACLGMASGLAWGCCVTRAIAHSPIPLLKPLKLAQALPEAEQLQLGSTGERVRELQQRLRALGYYDGPMDGNMGAQTQLAVIRFQRATGLATTGEVTSETWAQIERRYLSETFDAAQPDWLDEPEASVQGLETPMAQEPSVDRRSPTEQASPLDTGLTVTPSPTHPPPVAAGQRWSGWLSGLLTGVAIASGLFVSYQRVVHQKRNGGAIATSPLDPPLTDRRPDLAALTVPAEVMADPTLASTRPSAPADSAESTPHASAYHPSQATAGASLSETTRLPKISIVDELLNDLHSADPLQRRRAIWELGQEGDSRAVQPLVDLMMDADSQQRSLILTAISEIGVRTLKPVKRALLASLQDESAEVRKNAIRDVTRVYDLMTQIGHVLNHAMDDPDQDVQATARWAVSQLNRLRPIPEDSTQIPPPPNESHG